VVTEIPPAEVAAALSLSADVPAVVRRRMMLLDGRSAELTDSWFRCAQHRHQLPAKRNRLDRRVRRRSKLIESVSTGCRASGS
jgi:hypothetical protein